MGRDGGKKEREGGREGTCIICPMAPGLESMASACPASEGFVARSTCMIRSRMAWRGREGGREGRRAGREEGMCVRGALGLIRQQRGWEGVSQSFLPSLGVGGRERSREGRVRETGI